MAWHLQPSTAHAQDYEPGAPPDRAGARAQPEYDPLGIKLGTVIIHPSLTFSGTYDSNVFATDRNEQSDFYYTVTPAIRAESTSPEHTLAFNGYANIRRYDEFTEENDEQYAANILGRLNFGEHGTFHTTAGWSLTSPPRGTYENTLQRGSPLREERFSGTVGSDYRLNRLRIDSEIAVEKFDYDDVKFADGTVLDQDYRDGTRVGTRVGAYYLVSSRFSVMARADIEEFDFRDSAITSRDATGMYFTAGGLYEVTELFTLELGAGYRNHDFHNPLRKDIPGFAFNGRLRWYPTPLISVRLDLDQSTDTSTLPLVSAVSVSSAVFEADYEARRNVVVTARLQYSHEHYNGIDTNSDFMSASLRSNWKVNRWLRVGGSLTSERRASKRAFPVSEFDAFRGMLSVTLVK